MKNLPAEMIEWKKTGGFSAELRVRSLESWINIYKAFPTEPILREYALKAIQHYHPALAELIKDE